MQHISSAQTKFLLFLLYLVITVGCAHHPATADETIPASPASDTREFLIHEAREEADMLRSELAAIKIAAAKQHAELQSAKKRVDSFKAREEDLVSNVQEMKDSLLMAENERDQLRRENVELQSQSASIPDLQQLMGEVRTMQASVQQMVANMQTLMTEVVHIKQDMKKNQNNAQRGTTSLTAFSMTTPSKAMRGVWTVAAGDTLWSISQKHATTVDTLKAINKLDSDVIVEGQTLKVPMLASTTPANLKASKSQRQESEPTEQP